MPGCIATRLPVGEREAPPPAKLSADQSSNDGGSDKPDNRSDDPGQPFHPSPVVFDNGNSGDQTRLAVTMQNLVVLGQVDLIVLTSPGVLSDAQSPSC